jgi:hypothetical protein
MLKKALGARAGVPWLNRTTVYEGQLISMASRVVRLFAPDPKDAHPHVDLSYDWVVPLP